MDEAAEFLATMENVCALRKRTESSAIGLCEKHGAVPIDYVTAGIRDSFGNELEFPSAFRLSRREGKPRGIIKIGESS